MNEKSDYMKQFTANQWRTGENMRGETYHLWLTELAEKCDFTIASLTFLFEDTQNHYKFEKGLTKEDSLTNFELLAITNRVEKAIERLPYLEKQRRIDKQKKKNRKSNPFSFLKRLLSFLSD